MEIVCENFSCNLVLLSFRWLHRGGNCKEEPKAGKYFVLFSSAEPRVSIVSVLASGFSCPPSSSSLVCLIELMLRLWVIRGLCCVLGWISTFTSVPLLVCGGGARGPWMHAVSRAATTLMILLSWRSRLGGGLIHAVLAEGKECGCISVNSFCCFVLQNDFELAPPYRDYTRRVCDVVQREGKSGWWCPLDNVGDGAVLQRC